MKSLQSYDARVMGASATQTWAVDPTLLKRCTCVAFYIKTASTSGTVTATIEASPDNFTTLFEVPFDSLAENGTKTADSISLTTLGTAGQYVYIVHEAPVFYLRLKIVTSGASGATVTVWAVTSDDYISIN